MKAKDKVLNELLNNTNKYLSGEEIASTIGVSRNAIWKHVNSLKEDGYVIEAITNKGYKLIDYPDNLNAELIKADLRGACEHLEVEVRDVVTSTNTLLKENSSSYAGKDFLLVANEQTNGRGRLGRTFHSPSGTGVYFSLILHPKLSASDSQYLTTAIATAVARAIESVCNIPASIKWVNDIFVNEKKVCGILTEAVIDFEAGGLEYAIVGTGINITAPKEGYPEEIKDIAGALYEYNQAPKGIRNKLVAEIINNFYEYYIDLGNKPFFNEYKKRSFLMGHRVKVISNTTNPDDYFYANVIDIDEDFRLIVETDDWHEVALSTGEVSIRKV